MASPSRARRIQPVVLAGLAGMVAIGAAIGWFRRPSVTAATTAPLPAVSGPPTFHRDIAPIIHRHCTPCHQEGQPGPFPLITYADVAKRADQIVEVTTRRYMPPWLPDEGSIPFADSRRLSTQELDRIRQWTADGAPEGDRTASSTPVLLTQGWQLGQPDLIVQLAEPYQLPADGPDVYRNFVIPLSVPQRRFVRAVEFRPGTRVIHHAFLMLDPTRQSRRLDARDAEPGFGGVTVPPVVESPGGYFLSWQPGRRPIESPPGLAWALKPGYDLILQMHLQPSGKVEAVQPSIGFYFTDQAPTNAPLKISLSSYDIDIPAGAEAHQVTDRFVLPAEATLLSLLPHAHFLAKTMEGDAILPGGRPVPLLRIGEWDFNWQSDFRLQQPLTLPAGTELVMRYTYDNSTNNVRNPAHPPVRVRYGPQTRDEMGELWLQLLPRTPQAEAAIQSAYQQRLVSDALKYNTLLIEREPTNAHAHVQLGKARYALGETNQALQLMRKAIQLDPLDEEAHYNLGVLHLQAGRLRSATAELNRTLELNPENVGALNNLGLIRLHERQFDQAEELFRRVLRVNPDAEFARANLQLVAEERRNTPQ